MTNDSVTLAVNRAPSGRWVCQYFSDGEWRMFVGKSPAGAVNKAVNSIGEQNVAIAEVPRCG